MAASRCSNCGRNDPPEQTGPCPRCGEQRSPMPTVKPDPDWRERQRWPLYLGESEQERVFDWRLGELLRAGYPLKLAEQLAFDTTVDLHRALRLLEQGCSPELAALILL